jgi:hypothetical protein
VEWRAEKGRAVTVVLALEEKPELRYWMENVIAV